MTKERARFSPIPLLLFSCFAAFPARADAWIPSRVIPDPGFRPEATRPASGSASTVGLPPIDSPALAGGAGAGLIFDSPVTGRSSVAAPSIMMAWRGAPSSWNPPGLDGPGRGGGGTSDTNGDGRGASCERGNASFCPKPERPIPHDPPGAPGPLPVLGAAAAWGYSRKLRQRLQP